MGSEGGLQKISRGKPMQIAGAEDAEAVPNKLLERVQIDHFLGLIAIALFLCDCVAFSRRK